MEMRVLRSSSWQSSATILKGTKLAVEGKFQLQFVFSCMVRITELELCSCFHCVSSELCGAGEQRGPTGRVERCRQA